jgi:hypothetical protein
MNALTASWLFSVIPAALAWWAARSTGMDRLRALCFAAACFPTPVLTANAGRASFLYASDLAMPLALMLAVQSWFVAPVGFRRALALIVVGAGVLPLVGTAFTWPERAPILQNAINAIRLVNVAALGIAFSSRPVADESRANRMLIPYSALAMIIAVAMVLQVLQVLNTNVFHAELTPGDDASARLDQRLAVLGLFRGSIGVACLMAVAAWMAAPRSRCLQIGAVAGLLASTLIASKTTLLAIAVLGVVHVIRNGVTARVAAMACVFALPVTAVPFLFDAEDFKRLNAFLELFGTSVDNLSTATGRADIWGHAAMDLAADPSRLLGIANRGQLDAAVGVYHNEWLAVLMTGGMIGVVCTLVGVGAILFALLRRDEGAAHPLRRVALLTCIGMQIQALSVAHMQPNLFFLPVTAPLLILYALALRPQPAAPRMVVA